MVLAGPPNPMSVEPLASLFLGVTPRFEGDYTQARSIALASHQNQPNAFSAASNPRCGVGVRATWSRLAPCMARPNLFSGD